MALVASIMGITHFSTSSAIEFANKKIMINQRLDLAIEARHQLALEEKHQLDFEHRVQGQ